MSNIAAQTEQAIDILQDIFTAYCNDNMLELENLIMVKVFNLLNTVET
jgi:hypothetical protein